MILLLPANNVVICSLGKADVLLGGEDQAPPAPERVSTMALLSYSTCNEKWLMLAGLISAGIAGLAVSTCTFDKSHLTSGEMAPTCTCNVLIQLIFCYSL